MRYNRFNNSTKYIPYNIHNTPDCFIHKQNQTMPKIHPSDQIFHESDSEDSPNTSSIAVKQKQTTNNNNYCSHLIQLYSSPSKLPEDFDQVYSHLDHSLNPSNQKCLNYQPKKEQWEEQTKLKRKWQSCSNPQNESLYQYPSFDMNEGGTRLEKIQAKDQKTHENHLSGSSQQPSRKVRTMITEEKLHMMNVVFQNYEDNTSDSKSKQQKIGRAMLQKLVKDQPGINEVQIANVQSLKAASRILNLAYSTVLHKYKQFRQNKQVKGGSRMLSKYFKQKYKKSYQIEEYIGQALSQQPFYTALQLSKYICSKYGVYYPRCNINRHLAEMGFNLSMSSAYMKKLNTIKVKEIRCSYVKALQKITKCINKERIIYLDEFLFQKNHLTLSAKRQLIQNISNGQTQWQSDDYASLMVAASANRIAYYYIKKGIFNKNDFKIAIQNIRFTMDMTQNGQEEKAIILDMHPIHVDDRGSTNEQTIKSIFIENQFKRLYLPPYSPELNPCLSIFRQIQTRLSTHGIKKDFTCNSLSFQLQQAIEEISATSIEYHFENLSKWHKKSLQMQSF